MKKLIILAILIIGFRNILIAQTDRNITHLPIFDIHVHTMKMSPNWSSPMCPWFLKNMQGADPDEDAPYFMNLDCVDPLMPANSDEHMQEEVMKRIRDFNMTMVAFGDPEILHNWVKVAPPGRIIPDIGISNATEMTVEAFMDSLSNGFYKVMAEVAPQYQGISPSDPSLDPYFAIAEELNIPVGIHMGTGGNGMANITQPKYRASLGNPLLLEDLLARHPKMKIWVNACRLPFP